LTSTALNLPQAWERHRREWLLASGSVLLVVLLIGAIEVALRLANQQPPEGAIGPLHAYSEVYGWEPRKGLRTVDDGKVTTINAAGYRGPELRRDKGLRSRVIVLGDSIAFGLEVGDEETFERVLASKRPDLEVANLAVQGYDPGQELIKLEREGVPLRPDVVILALCLGNDFADAALPVFLYDGHHPKPFFTVEHGELVRHDEQLRLSTRERLGLFLTEHSRLYSLVTFRPSAPEGGNEPEHWTTRKRNALRDRAGAVDLTARLVARMAEDCRSRGIAFLVAAFPDKPTYREGSRWLRDLEESPVLTGVAFVDMAERFRARRLSFDSIALDAIGHLNPEGHRIAAEILNEALVDRGMIAAEPQPTTGAGSSAGS
jgi:hypothetical protein